MVEDDLKILLEHAAEAGAKRALASVGLHDENAGKDVHDLRLLIDGWRTTKRTVLDVIIKWLTIAALGIITLGAYVKFILGEPK